MASLCSENFILFFIAIFSFICFSSSTPFIVLHGITMACSDSGSTFYTSQLSLLSKSMVEIGNGAHDSVHMPLEKQVQIACEKVKGMKELQQGYNLVGLSQKKNNLCSGAAIYSDYNQAHFAPSGYTKLPDDIPGYLKGCRFLPKFNNEIPNAFNPIYKQRFSSLQNLVLVMFEQESVVTPKESCWFGFYQDGAYSQILPAQQTDVYKEDLFGLQILDKAGKVKFIKAQGRHLEITIPEMQQFVVPYLIDGAPNTSTSQVVH
ncbi:hypothetical protein P3L10_000725 [Capsicum annuum]